LIGGERLSVGVEHEPPVRLREASYRRVLLDWQLEPLRVLLEIGDHLVPRRIAVGVAGKRQAGQAAVAARREQGERLPPLSPGRGDRARFDDQEPPTLTSQEIRHGEAGLAGADDVTSTLESAS
jgi:hypothetical protein